MRKGTRRKPLEKGRYWFRAARYELTLDEGAVVVRPAAGVGVEQYDPWQAKPPGEQPHGPEGHRWSPHTHLAHLDPQSEEEALEFYNRWGPLGLWAVPSYKDRSPFRKDGLPAPERPMKKGFLAPEIQGWFSPPDAARNRLAHQEPLEFFEDEAREYQEWLKRLERAKADPDAATSAAWEAAAMLTGCHPRPWPPLREKDGKGKWALAWSFSSLLSFCYLRTVLTLVQEGSAFRQCANRRCGRLFLPTNPKQEFCSLTCQVAERVRRYRAKLLTGGLGPPATGPGVTQNVTETGREPRGNEGSGGQPGSPKPA